MDVKQFNSKVINDVNIITGVGTIEELSVKATNNEGISDELLDESITKFLQEMKHLLKKVLIIPPDFTRMHSGAGKITSKLYELLKDECEINILPALGTHEPMSADEINEMFGEAIPKELFIVHNWREDVVHIGTIPAEFVSEVSEGLIDEAIEVEVNKHLLDKSYDLIISIGQVVPHEVVGMANYSKNIFVGCGGSGMINKSHMIGAFYGMEKVMGKDYSPVRKIFDYAEKNFISELPIVYILTVTTQNGGNIKLHGLFAGRNRKLFEEAVQLSGEKNLTFVDKPLKKVIVYLDEKEFKSTWLGNKAIYRTRMAMADKGELIILAKGVKKFGEDDKNDLLIRKYGYVGRKNILEMCRENEELKNNLSVAAHLIHGSSDGRFNVTYAAPCLGRKWVEKVNYCYDDYEELYTKYSVAKLKDGFNLLPDGEEVFYIGNPALGLWADRSIF